MSPVDPKPEEANCGKQFSLSSISGYPDPAAALQFSALQTPALQKKFAEIFTFRRYWRKLASELLRNPSAGAKAAYRHN